MLPWYVGLSRSIENISLFIILFLTTTTQGIGVSKMFHFFLMPIDPNEKRRESKVIERKASGSAEKPASAPAENAEAADSTVTMAEHVHSRHFPSISVTPVVTLP